MEITVKKKKSLPKHSRKLQKCTDNEMEWTRLYFFGDDETKDNCVESYRKAYPNSSENTALAHSHKMLDRPGVKYAYSVLFAEYKKTFDQTIAECKDFPTEKKMLETLGKFILNEPNFNGDLFCKPKLQLDAVVIGLKLKGAFEKKIVSEDDIEGMEIIISTNDNNKLQEPTRKILDAEFK